MSEEHEAMWTVSMADFTNVQDAMEEFRFEAMKNGDAFDRKAAKDWWDGVDSHAVRNYEEKTVTLPLSLWTEGEEIYEGRITK